LIHRRFQDRLDRLRGYPEEIATPLNESMECKITGWFQPVVNAAFHRLTEKALVGISTYCLQPCSRSPPRPVTTS
jgi:hypothetical protein